MSRYLAGDFPDGTQLSNVFGSSCNLEVPGSRSINVNNVITSIEVITEQNKQKILAKVGWGVLAGAFLGPIGLLAGLLAGGHRKEVCVMCHIADGRSFLAVVSAKTHQNLLAAAFDNQRKFSSIKENPLILKQPMPQMPVEPPPRLTDAQKEEQEKEQYFYLDNNRQEGPFSFCDLQSFLEVNIITRETYILRNGETEWKQFKVLP